jgi:hypothetical protein
MTSQSLEQLKLKHKYETWRNTTTLEENLFIWKFFLTENEFPDWQPHRIQKVEAPGWPPFTQSIWRTPDGKMDRLLAVDVYECTSRLAAHELVVRLLGEFQSPGLERQKQEDTGDVAFTGHGDTFILFSRANLAVLVRNAGRELLPVFKTAWQFDQHLIGRPDAKAQKVIPEITRFATAPQVRLLPSEERKLQVGSLIGLWLDAIDPLQRPLWFKFLSRFGEVQVQEGRLVYRPTSAGSQEVTVFAINANQAATSEVIQFEVA